jgi:hypothetical protein
VGSPSSEQSGQETSHCLDTRYHCSSGADSSVHDSTRLVGEILQPLVGTSNEFAASCQVVREGARGGNRSSTQEHRGCSKQERGADQTEGGSNSDFRPR